MAGQWYWLAQRVYGRIPDRSNGGTKIGINGTSSISPQLNSGLYEVFAVTSSGTGLDVWVVGGASGSESAATIKDFKIPADTSRVINVHGGKNDYIAAITKAFYQGTLCILSMADIMKG